MDVKRRRTPDETRARKAIRNLLGKDRDGGLKWTDAELVNHAAEVLGGSDEAKLLAQAVYDKLKRERAAKVGV